MNCERAEGYLSAFLDNALDPRHCLQVRAHLEDCAHCRTILDDYRSFDHLLATSARIEPRESLRARIFESDEYRRILAAHEAGIDLSGEADVLHALEAPGLPDIAEPPDLPDDLPLDPDELILPALADLPEMGSEMGSQVSDAQASPGASGLSRLVRVGSAHWSKALLPVAALLTLSLGAAVLMKQGLLPFGVHTTGGLITTLGNPGQQGIPLAAGPRVLYLHDGILWSAPENGQGIAQPLTASGASGVTVGDWSISPTSRLVAYIDTRSGKLHVVRSDGLSDRVVGSSVSGGIAWSPDGARIAYLAAASGGHVLHVVNPDGSNDITISANGADAASAVWSADAAWIAYTEARDGVISVWSYDLTNNAAHALAPQADAIDAQASASLLTWLGDTHHPGVTWATGGANGTIAGVYTQSAFGGGSARQLTPSGTRYTAAAYSADRGAWLLGDRTSLTLLTVADGRRTTVAVLDSPASGIVWSSSGMAAVTHSGSLSLWSASTASAGLVAVDTSVGGIAPIWSADGQNLLYATTGGVRLAHIASSHATTTTVLQAADVSALGVAPDGHSIAVVTSAGIVLIAPDGTHAKLVDHHTPDGGVLAWSVAG